MERAIEGNDGLRDGTTKFTANLWKWDFQTFNFQNCSKKKMAHGSGSLHLKGESSSVVCELVNTCEIPCGKHYWSPTVVVGKVTQVIWKRNIYLNISLVWITNCIQILWINRTKIDWNVLPLYDQPLSLRFGCSWDNPAGFLPCHRHGSQSFTAPTPQKIAKSYLALFKWQ